MHGSSTFRRLNREAAIRSAVRGIIRQYYDGEEKRDIAIKRIQLVSGLDCGRAEDCLKRQDY